MSESEKTQLVQRARSAWKFAIVQRQVAGGMCALFVRIGNFEKARRFALLEERWDHAASAMNRLQVRLRS